MKLTTGQLKQLVKETIVESMPELGLASSDPEPNKLTSDDLKYIRYFLLVAPAEKVKLLATRYQDLLDKVERMAGKRERHHNEVNG